MTWRLVVPGSVGAVGWTKAFAPPTPCQSTLPDGRTFGWELVRIPTLRLSHYAHLVILEGLAPVWLFMGARLHPIDNGPGIPGPLILLSMKAAAIHQVPFALHDVAFAVGVQIPDGAKLTTLLPAMVGELYGNSAM